MPDSTKKVKKAGSSTNEINSFPDGQLPDSYTSQPGITQDIPEIEVKSELNMEATLGLHKTPYKEMNLDKNGNPNTPEEKLADFASNCPIFSLDASDLYALAGISKDVKDKERNIKIANRQLLKIQLECGKGTIEHKKAAIQKLIEIKKNLSKFDEEIRIQVGEAAIEEKTSANPIGQLEV